MTTPRYSALNSSRMTRTASSGSRYSSVGPLRLLGLGLDGVPLVEQAGHVGAQLVLGGVLGGGAHDEAVLGGLHPVEDVAQALAHVVGQALGDAVGLRVGDEHHEATGQRHLLGEAGTLGADRVLGDLADDQLLGAQHLLDARLAVTSRRCPRRRTARRRGTARRSSACRCRRTRPPCRAARSAPCRRRCCRGSG